MSISMDGERRLDLDKASTHKISKILGKKVIVKVDLSPMAQREFSSGRVSPVGGGIFFRLVTDIEHST